MLPTIASRVCQVTPLLLLLVAALSGCAHLDPVEMNPAILRQNIRAGTAVHEGGTVRVVTRDAVSHSLVVAGVDEQFLRGKATGAPQAAVIIEIPIDNILALEKEKVNVGESATGSVGVLTMVFAVALIIAPVAVLSALGMI